MLQPMCRKVLFIPPCPTLGRGHRSPIHLKYGPPGRELGEETGGEQREGKSLERVQERLSDDPGARKGDG